VRELVHRLTVGVGQESAGRKNCQSEEVGIVTVTGRKLPDLFVDDPKGTGYVIKYFGIRPPRFFNRKMFVTDLNGAFPFELQVPQYNFLGPGTRLQQTGKR
jgi:hypothetical protein